jgi:hypothetical protein
MRIVAFGHKSRMGKNTCATFFANYAKKDDKTTKITSFASLLKKVCFQMLEVYGLKDEYYYERYPEEKTIKLRELDMSPVDIWIKFGTPMVREQLHNDIWVRNTLKENKNDFLVISDLRFPNEAKAIKERGGILIKVHNPIIPLRDSIADKALDDFNMWDYTIDNSGSLSNLKMKIGELYVTASRLL